MQYLLTSSVYWSLFTASFQREQAFLTSRYVYEPPWRAWLVHPKTQLSFRISHLSRWCLIWGRWQRIEVGREGGWEIESQRRAGERIWSFVCVWYMKTGEKNRECPVPRVLPESTIPQNPQAIKHPLSARSVAQPRNEMWTSESQYCSNPCPCPPLGLKVYWAQSTSSGMQNDFLALPATQQQYFQLLVKLQMPHESFK